MQGAELRPVGVVESALAFGQELPGPAGLFFYRKLKRRLTDRTVHLFDKAVGTIGPGDIAIDLGAHVGVVTHRLAATGATVHAFEPDPIAFDMLRANVDGLPNVIVHRAAAAERDGKAVLHRTRWNAAAASAPPSRASSIVRRDRKMNLVDGIEVETIDFARFLRELPRPARLVKIDIEGAEWGLLRAVIDKALNRFEMMFVETHERFDEAVMSEARRLQRFAAGLDRPYINLYWK
jgi:FkbM family methyltransferase